MDARHQRRRSCRSATYLLVATLLIVQTAASSCPPPEEQSLADVHCSREIHTTQEALDLCYMKVRTAAQPHSTSPTCCEMSTARCRCCNAMLIGRRFGLLHDDCQRLMARIGLTGPAVDVLPPA